MKTSIENKWVRRVIVLGAMALFAFILVLINDFERDDIMSSDGRSFEKGIVVNVLKDNLTESGQRIGYQTVEVKVLSGYYKGRTLTVQSSSSYLYGAPCTKGLKVILMINKGSTDENNITANVYSYDRETGIYLLILFFVGVLWIIGGKKGFNAVIGLAFTFICIIFLFLPLIYKGVSPVRAAVLICFLTTAVVMYLLDGVTVKSITACIGTVLGVVCSAFISFVFGRITHINGYNVSDIEQLIFVSQVTDIKIGELLTAGILIASLGAVMDVAMSISSTINEIHSNNPELTKKELFASGLNVGKDMMGTMSNTLILAFAGNSINTLVYLYCYKYSFHQMMNMYSVGVELLQGISSTFGVIITVPITSFISSFLLNRK